jgi:erythromycin esterase-like protein
MFETDRPLLDVIRNHLVPLEHSARDYDALLELIGNAHFVLLGEASHGTHEFYRHRAEITQRLIEEKGFQAVAIEGDWPDTFRVHRFVMGANEDAETIDALAGFQRFPTWMWRNADVLDFLGWLRNHNDSISEPTRKTGFFGLDLYSLYASIDAVLNYLSKIDPEAARRARMRYACFENFSDDSQAYGYAAGTGMVDSCEDEVVGQLIELRQRAAEYARRDGWIAEEEFFSAEQNARLIKNAEHYYRAMYRGRVSSWNLRDRHMFETLEALTAYLRRRTGDARLVVWAHNSHLGDARATQMSQRGELNLGQLVREKHGDDAILIGFSTDHGTVTAASNWDEPAERKQVRPARADSFEGLFHRVNVPDFLLLLRPNRSALAPLRRERLERAIGVIYRPETELMSHYFYARLLEQFDAVIHLDETRAVEPLERAALWVSGEVPETYPSAV